MNTLGLSWRDVLDPKIMYHNIYTFLPVVRQSGYKYFNWNGIVYELVVVAAGETLSFAETNMIVEELL